ncbi:MAG: single-stranded DNA-binding protein [Spirochaetaceae bacterium]|nr:single-stranded DNA-binding protein [Spirochaetaceae bacterium]
MADINNVTLVGRLTRDAELKYTNNGMALTKLSIAVNSAKKDGDSWVNEASFFEVTLWGKQGESLNSYLTKGQQLGIEGRLRQERWEKDGQQQSRVSIVANNVMLLGSKSDRTSGNEESYERPPARSGGSQQARPAPAGNADFDDDIPF